MKIRERGLGTVGTGPGNEENRIWERGKQDLGTRKTGLGTRITGSENEENGI
jgi:hypothetical protein